MDRKEKSDAEVARLAARVDALTRENGALRAGLEGCLDAFFLVRCERDADGEIVDFVLVEVNASGERMMQRPREALVGARVCELFPAVRSAGLFAIYRQVVETREAVEGEYDRGDVEGGWGGWYLQRVAPAGDGVAVWRREVHAREQGQGERDALREQRQHAQKMESLGRLAGGIAHDFNNLLTPILAYANMGLMQLEDGAPLVEELQEIRQAAERASGLIRQILTFSGKQPMQVQPVALNGVIEGLERMLLRLVGDEVAVRLRLAPDLGNVMADPTRLEQILINLVVNAREAIAGEGEVTIGTANVEFGADATQARSGVEPGQYIMLEVRDTGVGMPADMLGRVFEPFFTTRDPSKGTGLGLPVVYGLMKQHRGAVRCESEPGVGSTFRLYLPRTQEDCYTSEEEPAPARGSGVYGGTETLLLVEDDVAVRRMARQVLIAEGYRVLEADNGQMALQVAADYTGVIDLLVSDVVMPKMGGRDLYAGLTQVRPGLRVVFMSGFSEVEIGALPFIAKPFAGDQLLGAVREALA